MFSKSLTSKDSFLEQTKAAREERALEKKREQSAVKIQAFIRGWLARQRFIKLILNEFDQLLPETTSHGSQEDSPQPLELIPALEVYKVTCRLFLVFKQKRDRKRFEKLCKYIVQSLHSDSVKLSYVGVFLNKEYSLRWITHIKDLLYKCCQYLEELKPESPLDMQSILIHLHTLVAFTATNTWALTRLKNFDKLRGGMTQLCANVMGSLFHKGYYLTLKSLLLRGLCREKVYMKNISLTAIVTLSLRPLVSSQFSEKLLTMYIIQILSVPTLVFHMQQISPENGVTCVGRVCVLSPHWQALKMLRTPRLRPYIVFIRPPSLERLAETRTTANARSTFDKECSRAFSEEEFTDIMRSSLRINFLYGYMFDEEIVNEELASALAQLLKAAWRVQSEPLWVPASWVQ